MSGLDESSVHSTGEVKGQRICESYDACDSSDPRTIGDAIRAHAEARPQQLAIVGSDFPSLSYRMLQVEIGGVRNLLRGAGLGRDARIAVALTSSAQATRAIVGNPSWAVWIPIDPKLTITEVERCFAILRPSAIVVLRGQNSA